MRISNFLSSTHVRAEEGDIMKTTQNVYREPLRHWNELSWIRSGVLREGELTGAMFSPELVPLAAHPRIAQDPEKVSRLLAYRLMTHLHFTTVLELEHVNVTCASLARGRSPFPLDADKRNDALRIYCDEGGHALFVELLLGQVEQHFDISRNVIGRPEFDAVLARIAAESPVSRALTELLFVSVSETLVSKILNDIPEDARVSEVVRGVLADHAQDESRHSAYFQWLFPMIWRCIAPKDVGAVAAMLANFLLAFLGPDRASEQRVLQSLGFAAVEAISMCDEVYDTRWLANSINDAAQPTLRMFTRAGILEHSEAAEVFANHGLILRAH